MIECRSFKFIHSFKFISSFKSIHSFRFIHPINPEPPSHGHRAQAEQLQPHTEANGGCGPRGAGGTAQAISLQAGNL